MPSTIKNHEEILSNFIRRLNEVKPPRIKNILLKPKMGKVIEQTMLTIGASRKTINPKNAIKNNIRMIARQVNFLVFMIQAFSSSKSKGISHSGHP